MTWQDQDEEPFRQALLDSEKAVEAVRVDMVMRGRDVYKPPLVIRPEFKDRAEYRDDGDLILDVESDKPKKVNVKWRHIVFTGRRDFPHPTLNIDSVREDRPLSDVYISVNEALTHAAAIATESTRDKWIEEWTDPAENRHTKRYRVYRCPIELVRFYRLMICPETHKCETCGAMAGNGYGVFWKGIFSSVDVPGKWYCSEHRPDRPLKP